MRYRADIDGLRALAVVPVLLYHIGVPGFPGGFVGVDIFFVISGYLICGMIDGDIRNGSFSLSNFYRRRALRILPALFVMFLVTSALAYFYCLPVELEDYARSLASAVGSISNVYFAGTAGYFDAPAETKPLLHTWSLGVEEQFYLVVPLLMLLAWRINADLVVNRRILRQPSAAQITDDFADNPCVALGNESSTPGFQFKNRRRGGVE